MNKDKDYHSDYDNFDYRNYYNSFKNPLTRGVNGELNNIVFYYDYDSRL